MNAKENIYKHAWSNVRISTTCAISENFVGNKVPNHFIYTIQKLLLINKWIIAFTAGFSMLNIIHIPVFVLRAGLNGNKNTCFNFIIIAFAWSISLLKEWMKLKKSWTLIYDDQLKIQKYNNGKLS